MTWVMSAIPRVVPRMLCVVFEIRLVGRLLNFTTRDDNFRHLYDT